MDTQYIVNGNGEKTAVIIPINEYEDLLHHHHSALELTDDYKVMMDKMIAREEDVNYISFKDIKDKFRRK